MRVRAELVEMSIPDVLKSLQDVKNILNHNRGIIRMMYRDEYEDRKVIWNLVEQLERAEELISNNHPNMVT